MYMYNSSSIEDVNILDHKDFQENSFNTLMLSQVFSNSLKNSNNILHQYSGNIQENKYFHPRSCKCSDSQSYRPSRTQPLELEISKQISIQTIFSLNNFDISKTEDCFQPNIHKVNYYADIPQFNNYIIYDIIGKGGHGIVFIIYDFDDMLELSTKSFLSLKFEFFTQFDSWDDILNDRNEHHIIAKGITKCSDKLKALIREKNSIECSHQVGYIVMQVAECDISNFLFHQKKVIFTKANTIYLLYCITNQLYNLYKKKITHRDVKPSNILFVYDFPNNKIDYILCDFSCCTKVPNGTLIITPTGTELYMAPELLTKFSKDISNKVCEYDPFKADIYSLGLSILELFIYPNTLNNLETIFKSINEKNIDKIIEDNDLRQLLKKMLELNPSKRISIENLLEELKKFAGYDNPCHPNIMFELINIRNIHKELFMPNKIALFVQKYFGVKIQDLRCKIFVELFLLEYNNNISEMVSHLEISSDFIDNLLIGMVYIFGFNKKITINIEKSIQIFEKISSNTSSHDLKHFTDSLLECLQKMFKRIETGKDVYWNLYRLEPFISAIFPNISIRTLVNFFFHFVGHNPSWVISLIRNFTKRMAGMVGHFKNKNDFFFKCIVDDLPFLNEWEIRKPDGNSTQEIYYSSFFNYEKVHAFSIAEMIERGVILLIHSTNPLHQKLYQIHVLIENFLLKNPDKRHYYQQMFAGKKYFIIKHQKYTLKKFLALKTLLEFKYDNDLAYQLFFDIVNALYYLKKMSIALPLLSLNMIQLSSIEETTFGLCKFNHAQIISNENLINKIEKLKLPYLAPEIFANHTIKYDPFPACLYGLACYIIQLLLKSRIPLDNPYETFIKFENSYQHKNYNKFDIDKCKKMHDFIKQMLSENPDHRPSLEAIFDSLNHKIIDQIVPVTNSNDGNNSARENIISDAFDQFPNNIHPLHHPIVAHTQKSTLNEFLIQNYYPNQKNNEFNEIQFKDSINLLKLIKILDTNYKSKIFYGTIQPHNIQKKSNEEFDFIGLDHPIKYEEYDDEFSLISFDKNDIKLNDYMSPEWVEFINQNKSKMQSDPSKIDIYALGTCIISIFRQIKDFKGSLTELLLDEIQMNAKKMKIYEGKSTKIFNILKVMIEENPEDRWSTTIFLKSPAYLRSVKIQ